METDEDTAKVPLLTALGESSVPGEVVASTGSEPVHVKVSADIMLCEAESEKERPLAVA